MVLSLQVKDNLRKWVFSHEPNGASFSVECWKEIISSDSSSNTSKILKACGVTVNLFLSLHNHWWFYINWEKHDPSHAPVNLRSSLHTSLVFKNSFNSPKSYSKIFYYKNGGESEIKI